MNGCNEVNLWTISIPEATFGVGAALLALILVPIATILVNGTNPRAISGATHDLLHAFYVHFFTDKPVHVLLFHNRYVSC
jgi:hypothetical protein